MAAYTNDDLRTLAVAAWQVHATAVGVTAPVVDAWTETDRYGSLVTYVKTADGTRYAPLYEQCTDGIEEFAAIDDGDERTSYSYAWTMGDNLSPVPANWQHPY